MAIVGDSTSVIAWMNGCSVAVMIEAISCGNCSGGEFLEFTHVAVLNTTWTE